MELQYAAGCSDKTPNEIMGWVLNDIEDAKC